MREEGLRGVHKGRLVPHTTDRAHRRAIAPNLLQTRLSVDGAVCAWASDIPYVAIREDWLYLAAILALKTRPMLGDSLSDRMPNARVLNALRAACHLAPPPPGTLFHSDRASQYARRFPRGARRARHGGPHESQRQMLGQCSCGEPLRDTPG